MTDAREEILSRLTKAGTALPPRVTRVSPPPMPDDPLAVLETRLAQNGGVLVANAAAAVWPTRIGLPTPVGEFEHIHCPDALARPGHDVTHRGVARTATDVHDLAPPRPLRIARRIRGRRERRRMARSVLALRTRRSAPRPTPRRRRSRERPRVEPPRRLRPDRPRRDPLRLVPDRPLEDRGHRTGARARRPRAEIDAPGAAPRLTNAPWRAASELSPSKPRGAPRRSCHHRSPVPRASARSESPCISA